MWDLFCPESLLPLVSNTELFMSMVLVLPTIIEAFCESSNLCTDRDTSFGL